jgi:hypothetical protein
MKKQRTAFEANNPDDDAAQRARVGGLAKSGFVVVNELFEHFARLRSAPQQRTMIRLLSAFGVVE